MVFGYQVPETDRQQPRLGLEAYTYRGCLELT